jgi:major type 1 subunit fimbrin (pilin)
MKNTKLASALALAMGLASVGTASAQTVGNSGTVYFRGAVTDTTCTVRGGDNTTPGDGSNFTVVLNDVPATDLSAANSTAAPKTFTVVIGGEGQTSCAATSSGGTLVATMTFVRSETVGVGGNLDNQLSAAGGGATNTQIQLLNGDDTAAAIDLSQPNAGAQNATIVNNTASMQYTAQYISIPGGATPGTVETNVAYQVAYN